MVLQQAILDLMGKGVIIDPEVIRAVRSGQYTIEALSGINLKEGEILTKKHFETKIVMQAPEETVVVTRPRKHIHAKDYPSKINIVNDYQENHNLKDTGSVLK